MIDARNLIVDLENLKYVSEKIIEYLTGKEYIIEESKKNEIQQIIIYLYNFLDEERYHSNVGMILKNYLNQNIEIQEKIELPYELEKYILGLKPIEKTTNKFEQDKKRILNSIIMLLNPIIKEENIKELKRQQKILTIPRGWC